MTQSVALSILKLGHTTFLTGAAGAGKSYVVREYITYLKRHGMRYAVTASTGIASTHIGGMTIHSWSGIGIKNSMSTYEIDAIEEKQNLYKRWNETQVLIIDEVSMMHASFIDMLDKVAKRIRRNDRPFGGIQVVFVGDFFQLPPVVRATSGYGEEYGNETTFAFTARAWREARPVVCYLTEQFRQDDDKLLYLLDSIRKGEIEEEHYDILSACKEKNHEGDYIKLYTHNENVDDINRIEFLKVQGEIKTYQMITKGRTSIVEGLKKNCLAEEVLQLKIGAKVICIKNAQDRSYVNGSLGVVVGFNNDDAPVVELVNGKKITVVADSWKIEEEGKVKAELTQLPIKLAWAITVHKSQGMTLDKAEIDLSRAFVAGQGYVALSRLKSLDGLLLKGFNPQALMVAEQVQEMDRTFKQKSEQAESAIEKYTAMELQALHEKFIMSSGGEVEELSDDEVAEMEEKKEKTPSHVITLSLLREGKTTKEIADARGVTEDTIIGHLEKISQAGEEIDVTALLPDSKVLDKIHEAFEKVKKEHDAYKLTPTHEILKGKYDYPTLRIVRIHLQNKLK